ncbi:MAG: hypothetical protein QOE86_2058 [Solirubrobacteraceae bacterium]|nr:hypothetical protein [Solirubrobacteraceae bacterium]
MRRVGRRVPDGRPNVRFGEHGTTRSGMAIDLARIAPASITGTMQFGARGVWEMQFWNLAAEAGHRHLSRNGFRTAVVTPPDLSHAGGELLFSECSALGRGQWTYGWPDAIGLLNLRAGRLEVNVVAGEPTRAADLAEQLQRELHDPDTHEHRVPLGFWTWTGNAARMESRSLHMPSWHDIAGHYPAGVEDELEDLMTSFEPGDGRLILWHGAPGTGKTSALRALAREWRDWADVQYVVDPEQFFGRGATYMTEVLTAPSTAGRSTLLVLEDAGELMVPAARTETGQGLSRLLNLTDGVLGQGLDTLVLITTNEPLAHLHPAVSRPGRCWSEIEFRAHKPHEANAWLAERGSSARVHDDAALADLFAAERGERPAPARRIGFA